MKAVYKNSALNIVAQLFVMLVMFFSMPWIVKGLGNVSFAILSLVWAVVAYFTLWDLGIGRAVTKFVAEKRVLGKSEDVADIVRISVLISLAIGVLFGILIFLSRSELETLLFTVPPGYAGIVRLAIAIVAVSMPVLILQGVFRGVLMGFDRFDLSNSVQVLNGVLQWVGTLVLVLLHFGVLWVIGFVMVTRAFTMVIVLVMSSGLVKWFRPGESFNLSLFKEILHFGGWAMVSQVVSPVLQYAERFMLSALVATGIVTFYVVPYEATSKMLVLSGGMVSALFPAMSEIHGAAGLSQEFRRLYRQSERVLVFSFLPIGAFLFMFSHEILLLWMGAAFAQEAVLPFKILSLTFVVSSVAQLPFTLLQAVGRPDLTGKVQLIELPIHLSVTFFMIKQLGLLGAAISTLIRMIMDVSLLYAFAARKLGLQLGILADFGKKFALPGAWILAGILCVSIIPDALVARALVAAVFLLLYVILVFKFSLEESERRAIAGIVARIAHV